jgi:hypothetical protein
MHPVSLWNNDINHEWILDDLPLVTPQIEFEGMIDISSKARSA